MEHLPISSLQHIGPSGEKKRRPLKYSFVQLFPDLQTIDSSYVVQLDKLDDLWEILNSSIQSMYIQVMDVKLPPLKLTISSLPPSEQVNPLLSFHDVDDNTCSHCYFSSQKILTLSSKEKVLVTLTPGSLDLTGIRRYSLLQKLLASIQDKSLLCSYTGILTKEVSLELSLFPCLKSVYVTLDSEYMQPVLQSGIQIYGLQRGRGNADTFLFSLDGDEFPSLQVLDYPIPLQRTFIEAVQRLFPNLRGIAINLDEIENNFDWNLLEPYEIIRVVSDEHLLPLQI